MLWLKLREHQRKGRQFTQLTNPSDDLYLTDGTFEVEGVFPWRRRGVVVEVVGIVVESMLRPG